MRVFRQRVFACEVTLDASVVIGFFLVATLDDQFVALGVHFQLLGTEVRAVNCHGKFLLVILHLNNFVS